MPQADHQPVKLYDSRDLSEEFCFDVWVGDVAEYPRFAYSKGSVRRAGEKLAGDISFENDGRDAAIEIFTIASSWRDSHILPMRSVRQSVRACLRSISVKGDMASRPKRMSSIRKKLARGDTDLHQMNDLAGCRAIIEDMRGVRALIERIREKFPHDIRREYPYIDQPKADGYRSHHFALSFVPRSKDAEHFEGRRVELQIRTRLQHAFATAIEAVDLYLGYDLKHGRGGNDWLRLFDLMSAEFAIAEGCPLREDLPDHPDIVRELKELNKKLKAITVLENIRNATNFAEHFYHEKGQYYLIRYNKDHTVDVSVFHGIIASSSKLFDQEIDIESGNDDAKVVLVEVDKVDKLIQTYPNYFGDVSLFVSNLRTVCEGKSAIEYSMAPQRIVAPKPHEKPNLDLLYRRYTRWEDKGRKK